MVCFIVEFPCFLLFEIFCISYLFSRTFLHLLPEVQVGGRAAKQPEAAHCRRLPCSRGEATSPYREFLFDSYVSLFLSNVSYFLDALANPESSPS